MKTYGGQRRYGWKKDKADARDYKLAVAPPVTPLPPLVDLRSTGLFAPCYDQGDLGSCTANAISGAVQYGQKKQGEAALNPSRLFIYYNERVIEGTVSEDAGAEIRDGIKSVAAQGVCPESLWPYTISKFRTKPSAAAYKQALANQAILYQSVPQTASSLQQVLASGFPVVFGFTVYESFESQAVAESGMVPMPKKGEKSLGGHAVLCVGYNIAKKLFIVRNSWGTSWADAGYCYFPQAYLTSSSLSDDFWVIKQME